MISHTLQVILLHYLIYSFSKTFCVWPYDRGLVSILQMWNWNSGIDCLQMASLGSVSTLLTSDPVVYLFLPLWAGQCGNSRFYWLGLWYGSLDLPLPGKGANLWSFSLSKFPKRKQLSARAGAWAWLVDSGAYRWLIAMCPGAAVNWYLLISKPLAEMGREGWESDISVNNHTWF